MDSDTLNQGGKSALKGSALSMAGGVADGAAIDVLPLPLPLPRLVPGHTASPGQLGAGLGAAGVPLRIPSMGGGAQGVPLPSPAELKVGQLCDGARLR